jgi:hypothetical protein
MQHSRDTRETLAHDAACAYATADSTRTALPPLPPVTTTTSSTTFATAHRKALFYHHQFTPWPIDLSLSPVAKVGAAVHLHRFCGAARAALRQQPPPGVRSQRTEDDPRRRRR